VPQSGSFIGNPMRKLVQYGDTVTIDDVRTALKWNTANVAGVPVGPSHRSPRLDSVAGIRAGERKTCCAKALPPPPGLMGIECPLQKTAVCVLDHDGQVVWQGKVDSEPGPLIDKLQLWRDQIDLVGLEACPLSEWLHRHLVAAGFKAICVETRHAQRFLSTGQ
jgi:hypothetical protein